MGRYPGGGSAFAAHRSPGHLSSGASVSLTWFSQGKMPLRLVPESYLCAQSIR